MHIPDGIMGNSVLLLICAVISVAILVTVFYKSKDQLDEKNLPLIALLVVATVIIQIIEIPLPLLACVHISLITVLALYDLKTSMIVYMFVTLIQAFLGEGGISTLGVNLFNLAIFAPVIAYGIYRILSKYNKIVSLFLSGFGTITLLGLIVSIEYALVGVFPLNYGLNTIVPVEAIVGILEGIATVVVMRALAKVKPELVPVMAE